MIFEKIILIESSIGKAEYLLLISEYPYEIDFGIPIMDVQLILLNQSGEVLPFQTLLIIGKELKAYLQENDVILFYYCDISEIQRSEKNQKLSPQNFRFHLFDMLYNRLNNSDFVKDDVIIKDSGEHYMTVISTPENKKILTEIAFEIEKINDK